MGDDDDGVALLLHVFHNLKEPLYFLGGEDRSGFIHNQDLGSPVEYLDNFKGLFFSNGHVVDLFIGVDVQPIGVGYVPYFLTEGLVSYDSFSLLT